MTQTEMVLWHLQDYGSITSWEAIEEYGATRLSAIIYNLRKAGYPITMKLKPTKNRYGETIHYGKYTLVKGGDSP